MITISAADVKRLRDETDAPMMDCKAALMEAEGDFDKAKQILREKGKAAAAKRADRATSAGVVAFASSPDDKAVGAVVLECETDFVAKNEDFIATANELAKMVLESGSEDSSNPAYLDKIHDLVNKTRENVQLAKARRLTSDGRIVTYVYQSLLTGAAVTVSGTANNLTEAGFKAAVQVVSSPPQVVRKEDLPQDVLDREIEIETQRAINEGKPENIARNIAQGRVNKEFVKSAALLEQPYYADGSKSVAQVLSEFASQGGGTITIEGFEHFAVGQS